MRTIRTFIFALTGLMSVTAAYAQTKCNCAANFKWVKETFEKNDAGFAYAIQQKGQAAYDKQVATLQKKITQSTSQSACVDILTEYLSFFRKAHYSMSANNPEVTGADHTGAWPEIKLTEEEVRKSAEQGNPSDYTGIWGTGAYRIAIVKNAEGYKGVILSAGTGKWKPGQVKLEISANGSGKFYMGNYSTVKFDQPLLIGKNTVKLGYVYLSRIYPVIPESESVALYAREISTDTPFLQELSKETVLLRVPSFDEGQRPLIDSLIASNYTLLTTKKNLIIDIRNNGGGSDISYSKITPLLYTNPIRSTNVELFSTPLNNQRMADYLKLDLSERSRNQVNAALEQLNSHLGQFVNLNGTVVSIQKMDAVLPNPKNVAVIINEANGSTAEEFLLMAKQSKKVKLFGKTTMGVLDISNMYFVDSPDKQFHLGYCLSKSLRIPDMKIDNIGIQPDFYIDRSIPDAEWLNFVKANLEQ
ncbi:S41 family peptidase [Mucilaginibacter sp. CAU 1740]|uniref:S41 family peptidase n=1 Tax=Mucilaginibacter sp. CAU 1740 TaxID=3140365 RepID=UPI00325B22E9